MARDSFKRYNFTSIKTLGFYTGAYKNFITHAGGKTHGFNREDDSPPFVNCR